MSSSRRCGRRAGRESSRSGCRPRICRQSRRLPGFPGQHPEARNHEGRRRSFSPSQIMVSSGSGMVARRGIREPHFGQDRSMLHSDGSSGARDQVWQFGVPPGRARQHLQPALAAHAPRRTARMELRERPPPVRSAQGSPPFCGAAFTVGELICAGFSVAAGGRRGGLDWISRLALGGNRPVEALL